ncbi:MAG TPA: pyruvate ferredoxin oxidoreductase [Phycisphaerae bacterium]|nr:pyruvate ferredoxin oxidoreductase [Phycisphaerae bacterium]
MAAKQEILEGAMAVAHAVARCRPEVVAAYPITPQTHISEELSQIVADGELDAEFVKVESEFGAASVCLGASATGARAYTATSSQGLMLMGEVLWNIAGMRLPIVLACANRSVSAPLSIWCDHQDAESVRDCGVLQLYAEDSQEACDQHVIAFRVAEDRRVLLPVMVNLDGFLLTHVFEPTELPDQALCDAFLPPYDAALKLDPANPATFGAFTEPDKCMEGRWMIHDAALRSLSVIEEVSAEFAKVFGRPSGGLLEEYRSQDAETILIAKGSICGTIKDVIDQVRDEGKKVGLVRIKTYRPWPKDALLKALASAKQVAVIERGASFGAGGVMTPEVKETLYDAGKVIPVSGYCVQLGGREVPPDGFREIIDRTSKGQRQKAYEYFRLRTEILPDLVPTK